MFLTYFILHNSQLPENIGEIALAMANFGFTDLRLASSECDVLDPTAVPMTVGTESIPKKRTGFWQY